MQAQRYVMSYQAQNTHNIPNDVAMHHAPSELSRGGNFSEESDRAEVVAAEEIIFVSVTGESERLSGVYTHTTSM